MTVVSYNPIEIKDGHNVVECVIVSDTTPDTLPTTGANVKGMKDDDTFAPMSLLYITGDVENKIYLADEDGEFVAQ